jgi:alkanesulfonate monooxygenase SsuD/methylene tetrahydromethanopterin reductase-like flavin-dependent oxidoreductase (luciferase family)
MKFGIYPSVTRGDGDLPRLFDEVAEEARAAEASGFTWCVVGEHHQEPALASPLLTAGLIAMRTVSIHVGTAVMLLPLHHPVHVAEQAAMIQAVSRGRLVLGVGIGYQPSDFALFDTPMAQRGARFDESLELIHSCWNEAEVHHDGAHYKLDGAGLGSRPSLPIPLWIGANSEVAMARVATKGDAWLVSRTMAAAKIQEWAVRYREAARQHGRPAQVLVIRDAWVARTREEALAAYENALVASLPHYAGNEAYVAQARAILARSGGAAAADDAVILGSVDDCIEQVARWQALGVDGVLLRFRHPAAPPHGEILDAVRLFGESVIGASARGAASSPVTKTCA